MKDSEQFATSMTAAYSMSSAEYPPETPFHPGVRYPEYPFGEMGPPNGVYDAVRSLLHLLKLDDAHYDSPEWNPLGSLVFPGDKVLIKPNYLWHAHKYNVDEWEQVITHGSVIRAVVDYVLIALDGRGEVWIADGPQLDANWNEIIHRTGMEGVCAWYTSESPVQVRLLDLRDTWEDVRGDVYYGTLDLPGDPAGATVVNLGDRSRFVGHEGAGHYYGASADQAETNYHHSEGRHEYRMSRTAASADVFINVPKMKTHKKVGVTLSMKNLVGINTGRNWLPHHTDGDPSCGGDQFPQSSLLTRSERWGIGHLKRLNQRHPKLVSGLFRLARAIATPIWGHTSKTIRSGNWHGNDTTWRMVQDINRCLLYSNGETFPTQYPKRYFSVVDGVVAGDNEGPAAPDRYEAGVIIAGFNPVAVDCTTARLMGFDPMKIAMLREAFEPADLPLAPFDYTDIMIRSNRPDWRVAITDIRDTDVYHFRPHFGWWGRIERGRDSRCSEAGSASPV